MRALDRIIHGFAVAAALAAGGCAGQAMSGTPGQNGQDPGDPLRASPDAGVVDTTQLAQREVNYGLALRTAAVKLVGDLPTLQEQQDILASTTPKQAYEAQIDKYLADPRFTSQMIRYFRNTFKMGGQLKVGQAMVNLDTAPTFAAELVVQDRPFSEVWTAKTATCPTYDAGSETFADEECGNGAATAGVLTDPGVQAQFMSNLAFRRVRWVQETFDCRKFPTEYVKAPVKMGNGLYTSPWPFDSISGGPDVAVDFHDTKSVVCANCHSTMNHIAPLFARFDGAGMWQADIQVTAPTKGLPKAKLTDWLPAGEPTSWRFGVEVSDLPALGKAMAADAEVNACVVVRAYDWAMSKDDVVLDLATVPDVVIAPYLTDYQEHGMRLKKTIRALFTSDDFVKF